MSEHVTLSNSPVNIRNNDLLSVIPEEHSPFHSLCPLELSGDNKRDLIRAFLKIQFLKLFIGGSQTLLVENLRLLVASVC
jgi:hypothetical protein